jgi:hypothetical protein
VDVIPTWTAPHHFTRIATDVGDAEADAMEPVFTYVLASCELSTALESHDPIGRLSDRLGLEWVASLVDRLQDNRPSRLTTFFRDEAGIGSPGQPSWNASTGQPYADRIPDEIAADFLANSLPRLHEFAIYLAPLTAELAVAADLREPPNLARVNYPGGESGFQAAEGLLETYAPKLRYTALRNPHGNVVWGLAFDNLASRIAAELFELFATRPQIRRCHFCQRVFVPLAGGSKTTCHAHLWRQRARSKFVTVETCNPQATDTHNAAAHTRERKRRHRAMQREIERFGPDSRRGKIAVRNYDNWIAENGKRRGPKQRPMPPAITRNAHPTTTARAKPL